MCFATFFLILFVIVHIVFVTPSEALPLLGHRSLHGSSHEVLVPVQVIPARRVGNIPLSLLSTPSARHSCREGNILS